MKKKEFKTESKKLMNLMINSIYTNKEIFLREIISNSSDALDKLHYESLTNKDIKINKSKLEINIGINKNKRELTISDNGIGMTQDELENNLGTIAKSGSLEFKNNNQPKKDIDIIGQFGVGFYSAFMVASKITVISKSFNSDEAYSWTSEGIDGYTISKAKRDNCGTDVILTIKQNTDEENYDHYLDQYEIENLIKKYSNYITYPIKMELEKQTLKPKKNKEDKDEYETSKELTVINDLIPIWKRNKNKITDEEYNTFYSDKFFDYDKPLTKIHVEAEGLINYNALIYIPSHAPFDYYTKEYEKGLQLYSNGVLIMEKCADLVPDYFSFIKGIVDSPDLSLNISREILQQNKVLKQIAKSIENKIKKELENMRDNNRKDYEQFFNAFGLQLKYGIYNDYGVNKDALQDLIMFKSSKDKQLITLKEYTDRMKEDQKEIYYACGETVDKVDLLPQVEKIKNKNYEILYCIDYIDEFALKTLNTYNNKAFKNISDNNLDLDTEDEKKELNKINEEAKDMFAIMKEAIPEIKDIKFTNKLQTHPVCLSTKGDISIEMEKAINMMPTDSKIKADKILEINENHEIVNKLKALYKNNKEELKSYAKILYAEARLIEGLTVENPTELSNLICNIMAK